MGTHTGNVITLSNSIIGVSVLAMPFCFKQCGIILSILMLLFSNIVTRLACHYLMKSAIMEKRKNFEMLAFRVFGPTGKLIVELCIIGFMLGTCVAYFVIIGDLGPGIIGPAFGFEHPTALRPSVLIAVAVLVVLPLGLLKNVDSLSGVCAATIAFYFCLVLKVMGEAINHLFNFDWTDKVYYWRPSGILQCIPIFSMALSCQTQLFEIFDSLPSTPLDRMNAVVKSAINMVTLFYISVGFFGYIAYCDQTFSGNLMMNFSPTMTSDVIKIGFLLSVAVSFPLVIFPCRASIYSLFFSKGYEHAQTGSAHIPESRFQCITLVIVTLSLVAGLLIPNIEVVLGLVGSTIGVIVCVIIPAIIFVSLTYKNNNERLVAKFLVCTGLVIMVLGTYANLYATEEAVSGPERNIVVPIKKIEPPELPKILKKVEIKDETLKNLENVDELAALPELKPLANKVDKSKVESNLVGNVANEKEGNKQPAVIVEPEIIKDAKKEPPIPEEPVIKEVKKEPPVPEEPVDKVKKIIPVLKETKILEEYNKNLPTLDEKNVINDVKKEPPVPEEPEPIRKVDDTPLIEIKGEKESKVESLLNNNNAEKKPLGIAEKVNIKEVDNKVQKLKLIEKLKEHEEEQKKLNERGEKILEELKDVLLKNGNGNLTKDTLKIVNVKTGVVTDIKASKLSTNVSENIIKKEEKKDSLSDTIAKGLPLPLAVKGHLDEIKRKDEKKKTENEVVKSDVGRDKLAGDKEIREKRDVDEILKEDPLEASKFVLQNAPSPSPHNKSQATEDSVKAIKIPVYKETDRQDTLAKLKVGLDNCVKNETKKVEETPHKVDTPLESGNKVDELIKSPLYLSNSNPEFKASPQLLSESDQADLPEMPKKRDLKSLSSEEFTESKHKKH